MKQYITNNIIAVALIAFGTLSASAQTKITTQTSDDGRTTTTYETETVTRTDSVEIHYYTKYHQRFFDNWSLDALGSARVLFAEEDGHLAFGKRIRPAFTLGLTKAFTPDISFRGLFSCGGFKGWNSAEPGLYKKTASWGTEDPVRTYLEGQGIDCSNGYIQNLRYFTIDLDVMLHLYNLFVSHNQLNRVWDPYFYAGLEYFQLLPYKGYKGTYKIGGHTGLKCDLNLSKKVALTGEAGLAIHSATFDNEIGKGHKMDTYAYASLGVKVRLGRQGYRIDRVLLDGDYLRLGNVVTDINEYYNIPSSASSQVLILGDLFAPSVVFDDNLDTYSEELQMANISRMAQYIKDNPALRVSVIGNTHTVGPKLAQRRADIIRQKLIDRYGIAPSRLVATTLDVTTEFNAKGSDQSVNFGVTK